MPFGGRKKKCILNIEKRALKKIKRGERNEKVRKKNIGNSNGTYNDNVTGGLRFGRK